jgi:hypothetical protein
MNPDHLHHWQAIGAHLGIKPDAARNLAKTAGLPVFKIGKTVAASKAAINHWLAEQATKAVVR